MVDYRLASGTMCTVCIHVSFLSGASVRTEAYYGSGSGPIHLDYVVCSGTEYNLTDCETGEKTRQSSHSEDVGVKCQTGKLCVVIYTILNQYIALS